MPLRMPLRQSAVLLSSLSLLGAGTTNNHLAVSPTPEILVAEAPIWGPNDALQGYAFLRVAIHGKPATLGIDLTNEGTLLLSTAALSRLGVTLDEATTELDSLTIDSVVERHIPVKLNRRPNWSVAGPPDFPPVVGVIGVQFINRYDVLYDFPHRRVRLYLPSKKPSQSRAATWLPPEIKSTDCGKMVRIPTGAETFIGVEMQLDGHPVTGVLEMGPYYEKMNLEAVKAMGLTTESPQVQPIKWNPPDLPDSIDLTPEYNGYRLTHQVRDVHMTIGRHTFWTGIVQIWPVLDVQRLLKPKTPVMLMNLRTIRKVVVFNSVSSEQVCVSTP